MDQNLSKPGPRQLHSANWRPGQSGNLNGRPPGIVDARHRFSTAFLNDLADSWRENGARVLATVAEKSPESYFAVCSRLIGPEVKLTLETQLSGGSTPDDIAILRAISRTTQCRRAGAACGVAAVLNAVRAYDAKVIEVK
jgi:hypothetical protein